MDFGCAFDEQFRPGGGSVAGKDMLQHDQHRPAGRRVARTLAGIMQANPARQVFGNAGIEARVAAAKNVEGARLCTLI